MYRIEKECAECHQKFVIYQPSENRRIFCSVECKMRNRRKVELDNAHRLRDLDKAFLHDEKPEVKKRRRRKGPSVAEIAVEARKEHLSYGQYVAKYGL